MNNEVHTFIVDDQDHPRMVEIHAELKRLLGLLHDAGYVPYTKFVPYGVGEEEKLFHLCHHSEKLTVAFGLINTVLGTPLLVLKNLRVCEDCHLFTKFISKHSLESNCGEGCQSLSSLQGWHLFLHGLLVMPVVSLVNHHTKWILFVAHLVVVLP